MASGSNNRLSKSVTVRVPWDVVRSLEAEAAQLGVRVATIIHRRLSAPSYGPGRMPSLRPDPAISLVANGMKDFVIGEG